MKIGVISDLHVDRNQPKLTAGQSYADLLSSLVHEHSLDLLCIAGDNSNTHTTSQAFLNHLEQKIAIPVVFIPGNHDYWSIENHVTDTQQLYQFYKQQPESLLERPYIINDEWAIVGNSAWYDYCAGSKTFTTAEFAQGHYAKRTWQDKNYVHWGQSDQDISHWMLALIEKDLQSVGNRNIILMTHMVTHPAFCVPETIDNWRFFNAFIMSGGFDQLYANYPIRYSIMGHVHFRKEYHQNGITYLCACLGNHEEWQTDSPLEEMQDALKIIELPKNHTK